MEYQQYLLTQGDQNSKHDKKVNDPQEMQLPPLQLATMNATRYE